MKVNNPVVVDVGANVGDFAIEVAVRNPNALVIAVEPNPDLVKTIQRRVDDLSLTNCLVIAAAISNSSGRRILNLSDSGDKGTSSLLSFNSKTLETHDYWTLRDDLTHNRSVEVDSCQLSDLLIGLGVEEVDFLKIDTQGLDIDVLISLGDIRTRAGMLESAATPADALYLNEPCLQEVLTQMERLGYTVNSIKPNDPACAEVNVFFADAQTNFSDVVMELRLEGIYLFDGKNYWWNPSSKPINETEDIMSKLAEELNVAREKHLIAEVCIQNLSDDVRLLQEDNSKLRVSLAETEHTLNEVKSSVTWKILTWVNEFLKKWGIVR